MARRAIIRTDQPDAVPDGLTFPTTVESLASGNWEEEVPDIPLVGFAPGTDLGLFMNIDAPRVRLRIEHVAYLNDPDLAQAVSLRLDRDETTVIIIES